LGGRFRLTAASVLATSALCGAGLPVTRAADEIQVYNADINEVGQFSIQHHFNYPIIGICTPDYPGALVSNHALRVRPGTSSRIA
jgi:hypothetical protein